MRKLSILACAIAFGLLGMAAHGATSAKKKSAAKKGTRTVASAHKSATTKAGAARNSGSRTASSRRGKKSPTRRASWRNRQLSPTPERYKEIQQALAAKGYLPAEQVNGRWDDSSTAALRKFQADQNLDGNGKINSLSLIALGLGPKRETAATAKAAPPPAAAPVPETAPAATANP